MDIQKDAEASVRKSHGPRRNNPTETAALVLIVVLFAEEAYIAEAES